MSVTLRKTVEIAIAAERAAETLYLGLQAMFAHHEPVAAYWGQYAFAEAKHAEWLEGLLDRLDSETLDQRLDGEVEYMLNEVAGFSVENALRHVDDLEDAYQLVHRLESAETNAIFKFLLDHFEPDREMKEFLRLQLEKHVEKLATDFPLEYRGTAMRKRTQALKG